MRPIAALLTALLATAVLAACGGDDKDSSSTSASTTPPAAQTETAPAAETETTAEPTASTGGCTAAKPAASGARDVPKPTKKDALPEGKKAIVTLDTSCGTIEIELDQAAQPVTASAFAYLVKQKFYDGLTFHRVIQEFVIQGGDPLGTGMGGPGWTVQEDPPADAQYTRGVVAMAKTGAEAPGTSGSQFFIVTSADSGLPAEYAIAGKVISGDQAVTQIAAVTTDAEDKPTEPVVIEKATLKVG
jgi:peptidyl-prolyl cis-trans isomerase B (cyclophilin B)